MPTNSNVEHELKFVPSQVTQIKLLASLQYDFMGDLIATISGALGISDLYALFPLGMEGIYDIYFDTESLDLFHEQNSLRVRHSGREIEITIKKNRGVIGGEFKRDEYSITCDQETLQDHIRDNFVEITREHLPHLSGKALEPVIIVKNSRRLFVMQLKDKTDGDIGFRAQMSFDIFTLLNARTGRSTNEMYELEIEALNESASQRLTDIASNIRVVAPDLKPSSTSKYVRGVQHFKLTKSLTVQTMDNWIQGAGFNWFSLILAIVGFILTIIGLL